MEMSIVKRKGGSSVKQGTAKPWIKAPHPKWYLLRTTNQYAEERSLSLFGGSSSVEKSFSIIKEEGEKALRAGYSRLLLAWNFIFHLEKGQLISWITENPRMFALSVHKKSFKLFQKMFRMHLSKDLLIDLILEDYDKGLLNDIESQPIPFQITISAHREMNLSETAQKLSERYKTKTDRQNRPFYIGIHFPCFHKPHPLLYSSEEVYGFLKKDFYPPPPIDIYNLSTPEDLELEPEKEPEFLFRISHSKPMASVIIPAYNCAQELIITLRHLSRQDLPKPQWELIVIDDGSEGCMGEDLKGLDFLSNMNFKFIFFPRKQKRGGFADHRFRAGIARNLGVKQSEGPFLLFLDSDILTPPFYLSSVCQQLETEDVIQHPRYHLVKSAPVEYSQIDKNKHSFIKGSGYWEDFYRTAHNWNQKKLAWKYISTNTLCLKKSAFNQVGRFRKNYTCYGFEDTDLGYRLYQAGFRFKLNPVDTYHLFRSSEFLDSELLRRRLLGFSANVFFHNSHCLEGYEEFRHLIQGAVS